MRLETTSWNDSRSVETIVSDAREQSRDYLLLRSSPSMENDESFSPDVPSQGILVYRDTAQTQLWQRLNLVLPASNYLLAVRPEFHAAVAVAIADSAISNLVKSSGSLSEFVQKVARHSQVSFVDHCPGKSACPIPYPSLTATEGSPGAAWVATAIRQLVSNASDSIELTAIKAGLFLVNDLFDDSHSESQSIEGQGNCRTGDYWHAILHRREPDYGNSKYWFRHVGRHPVFQELARTVQQRLETAEPMLPGELQPWKSRLVTRDSWDPYAFVDLCSAAVNNPQLKAWCEQLQYDEILLLLEWSARDASRFMAL